MARIVVLIALFAISNIGVAQTPVEFRHDVSDSVRPCAHEDFDAADDKFIRVNIIAAVVILYHYERLLELKTNK